MKTASIIIYIIICIALIIVITIQKSKQQSLTVLSGQSTTFWDKAKSRSKESRLTKLTVILSVLFFAIATILVVTGGAV